MFTVPKYTYHFLGIPEGSQYTEEMTVQASNLQEAEGKLRRQYGANPKNCQHTGNSAPEGDSSSSGGGFELGGMLPCGLVGLFCSLYFFHISFRLGPNCPCMLGTL